MLQQLMIGAFVLSLTVVVHALFIWAAISIDHRRGWTRGEGQFLKEVPVLIFSAVWILIAHILEIGIWAATLLKLGIFDAMEPAVYFSIVTFTTLGFGGIELPLEWRLIGGLIAANGFLLFGLSTAFLVEFINRMRRRNHHPSHESDR